MSMEAVCFSIGAYTLWISCFRFLQGGRIERIYCTFDHITNKDVDDGFRLTMYFDDGSEAYCEVGTYNFTSMPRFYMRAEKGTALISDWREETKVVKCKYWHESDVLPVEKLLRDLLRQWRPW